MAKTIRTKCFYYKIIKTWSLDELKKHKEHSRLKVFYHKGCKCVECGIEGTQIALGRDNGGREHLDVYTDDFLPITVDHIIPKSKGGSNALDNLQPMCSPCNSKKGNGDPIVRVYIQVELTIGMEVWRRESKGRKRKRYKRLGIITGIGLNPHTQQPSVNVDNNNESWYHSKNLYTKINPIN